jgi:hypothetical protein
MASNFFPAAPQATPIAWPNKRSKLRGIKPEEIQDRGMAIKNARAL